MPFVSGFLRVRGRPGGGGPVDPGWGVEEGGAGIDNTLPGEPPMVDNTLPGHPGVGGPVDPGFGVGLPPVISHPIAPGGERPGHLPSRPTYPVDPGYGLPKPPHMWPRPPYPPTVWPPPYPVDPDVPMYPERPDNALPLPPGAVWPPLSPEISGKVMVICWVVGVGYRWTVLDPSLKPSQPLPGDRPAVSPPIAPTPEPRR